MPFQFKSINSISNFGLYQNFLWDTSTLGQLDRYNLIFGYNYSGKTTLSRLFQFIEDGALSLDYASGAFEVELTDQSVLKPPFTSNQPLLKVFNRDFVARNFHQTSDMTGANAITVVAEVNQALKDRTKILNDRIARLRSFKERVRSDSKLIQDTLDNAGTAQAYTINQLVGGGRYTRASLNADIGRLPTSHTPLPLVPEELERLNEKYRRAGDFEEIPTHHRILTASDTTPSINLFAIRKIKRSLREVATNNALASLKGNRTLEDWIERGIPLNSEEQPCAFCGNVISMERWEAIRGHFSTAFSELQSRIKSFKESVAALRVESVAAKTNELFPELRDSFALAVIDVNAKCQTLTDALASTVVALDSKLQNLESAIEWEPDLSLLRKLADSVGRLNAIIEDHNTLVNSAGQVKADAKENICLHFTVDYLRQFHYIQRTVEIDSHTTRISKADDAIRDIVTKIVAVELQIKAASIGIQKINYYLSLLLRGDIIGTKLNDTDFEFRRGGHPAQNMSEGERTAVAFSYFLATLEDGGNTIGDLVIVVDDPISSLDENHIYDVYAIIKDILGKANQLIVFTHNSYFFGLMKDWIKDKTGGRFKFLMTERLQSAQGAWSSTLVVLPRMLRNFKSTYQQEYYKLKKLNDTQNPPVESLMEVPNLLRGVLEAYLGFMFPEAGGINDKLPKILSDTTKCEAIAKYAHDNSHRHISMSLGEIQAYTVHAKNVIADAMAAIRAYSPDHVNSLEALYVKEAAHL